MTDRCSSCGAQIVWAKFKDKAIPLNKRRVRAYLAEEGDFHLLENTDLSGFPGWPEVEAPLLVHISHFLTCPNASSHSKAKT